VIREKTVGENEEVSIEDVAGSIVKHMALKGNVQYIFGVLFPIIDEEHRHFIFFLQFDTNGEFGEREATWSHGRVRVYVFQSFQTGALCLCSDGDSSLIGYLCVS
jgi:hypothetical protein